MRSVLRAKSDHACVTGDRAGVFAPAVPSGRIGAAVDKDWLAVLGRLLADRQVDPASTICVIVSETGLKTEAPPPSREAFAFDVDSLRALVLEKLRPGR